MTRKPRGQGLARRPPRPFSVTLLALGVLIIAGIHWVRFSEAIAQRNFLLEIAPNLFPYLLSSGLIWGTLWLLLAWGLWLGKRWARRGTLIVTPIYGLYYWLDRLLLRRNNLYDIPFWLATTLLVLLFIFGVLTRPKVRDFFNI